MLAVIAMILVIGGTIAGSLIRGFVLSKLWLWLVVLVFGLTALTIAQAIGISIVLAFLTHQSKEHKDDRERDDIIKQFIGDFLISPFIVLLFGYIVSRYI